MAAFIVVDRRDGTNWNQFIYSTAKKALKEHDGNWRTAVLEVSFGRDRDMVLVPGSELSVADFEKAMAADITDAENTLEWARVFYAPGGGGENNTDEMIAHSEERLAEAKAIRRSDLLWLS